jgi:CIC family chloride channel protein
MTILDRLRNGSRRFLLATQIVVGVVCGLAAFAFHELVERIRTWTIGSALTHTGALRVVLILGIPAAAALLIAAVIRRWAPGAGGANLARVRRAYGQEPEILDARTVAATFFLTPLSLGSGAPLGPEGPIVVVSSGLAAGLARWLRLPRKVVRGMIPVGTAAGIAAIFNAPITGVVFALEEILGTAERGVLGGAIVAAVAAAVVEHYLLGGHPLLAAEAPGWSHAAELPVFAAVGALAGLLSGLIILGARRLRPRLSRVLPSSSARAALSGLGVGAIALASPSILGVGYDAVSGWLHGAGNLPEAGGALAGKAVAFVIALSGGLIGGTFAPSLFLGAALGSSVRQAATLLLPGLGLRPGAYALVGMGAFFAGMLRCPIAAVLIVVEVTGDYALVLPLMLAVSLAIGISRRICRHNLVEQQLREEGVGLSDGRPDPLSGLRVAAVMTPEVIAVARDMTVLEAARAIAGSKHRFYPVIDREGILLGVVDADSIDSAARDDRLDRTMRELVHSPAIVAVADQPVHELVRSMAAAGTTRCPVVAADGSRRLVGFVSPQDLLRARIRGLDEA